MIATLLLVLGDIGGLKGLYLRYFHVYIFSFDYKLQIIKTLYK